MWDWINFELNFAWKFAWKIKFSFHRNFISLSVAKCCLLTLKGFGMYRITIFEGIYIESKKNVCSFFDRHVLSHSRVTNTFPIVIVHPQSSLLSINSWNMEIFWIKSNLRRRGIYLLSLMRSFGNLNAGTICRHGLVSSLKIPPF